MAAPMLRVSPVAPCCPCPANDHDYRILQRIPALAGLLSLDNDSFGKAVEIQSFLDQEVLYQIHERGERMFVLLEGQVLLTPTPEPEEKADILDLLAPGAWFGEEAAVGRPYLLTAQAIGSGRLLAIDTNLVRLNSAAIFDRLFQRQRWLIEEISALKTVPPAQRLARLILALAGNPRPRSGGGIKHQGVGGGRGSFPVEIKIPCTKRLMARRIGVTPESLSRLFQRLRSLGVTTCQDVISIADLAALRSFSTTRSFMRDDGRGEKGLQAP